MTNPQTNVHLRDLLNETTDPSDGSQTTFAELYVRECINSICRAHQRQNPMPVDERRKTAELVVKYYGEWLIDEVKLFEERLDMGFLGIRNMNGQMEYDIKAIDRSNLLRFFKAYDEQRAPSAKQDENVGERTIQELQMEALKKGRWSPFPVFGDYHRQFDSYGNKMPKGWDFQSHWDAWFRTHKLGGAEVTEEDIAAGWDPVAYWLRTPKEWEPQEEIEALMERVCAKAHKRFDY